MHEAERAGLRRGGGDDQLTDELLARVANAVRPGRPQGVGRGDTWELCESQRAFTKEKLKEELTITKIARLLKRRTGHTIPYRTLHRFCAIELGHRSPQATVPVDDGEPGSELQFDFGRMWCLSDAGMRIYGTTRNRPLEVFEAEELPHLLPVPGRRHSGSAYRGSQRP